jgi:hypothetical protein
VNATKPRTIRLVFVAKGGLLEFFLNRGWVVHSVLDAPSKAALDDAMKDARENGGTNVMVIWREGTAHVIRRGPAELERRTRK